MKIIIGHSPQFQHEVRRNARKIDSWPCDVNEKGEVESNAGVEHLVEHEGSYFLFVTGHFPTEVYPGTFREINEVDKDDGFIYELIQKDREAQQCQ